MIHRNLEEWSKEKLIRELHKLEAADERAAASFDDADPKRVLHDLHVHQIQLEMQNRELREAQELLEESRGRYADLYDFAPVGYCTLDKSGRIREINLTGASLLGVPREYLIDRPFASVVPIGDQSAFLDHLKRCLEGKGPVTTELTMSLEGRGVVVVQMVSTTIRDGDRSPTGCRTILVDISALKQLEDRLRFLAELGETLAESLDSRSTVAAAAHSTVPLLADVCFVDLLDDAGEVERVEVVFADVKKQAMLADQMIKFAPHAGRRTPQSIVIATGESMILPQLEGDLLDRISHDQQYASVMKSIGLHSMMVVPLCRHGGGVFGALTFVTAESHRRYSSADLLFAEDIARRAAMAMDNARLHERAQRAIHAREALLGAVSHDLKNPLSVILLKTDGMLSIPEVDDRRAQGRKDIESIRRSAERMTRIIGDLLDIASIESGHLFVEKEPQPIERLVGEAVEMFQGLAAQKSVRLHRDLQHPGSVVCDRGRILQVFTNLIDNAIKFARKGDSITVRTESRAGELRVSVTDTGPGIPADQLPYIFDRFWQDRKTARLGTGLGLSIAKGIIEAHGGRIWAESQVGVGSTFLFTIPEIDAELRAPRETRELHSVGAPAPILPAGAAEGAPPTST